MMINLRRLVVTALMLGWYGLSNGGSIIKKQLARPKAIVSKKADPIVQQPITANTTKVSSSRQIQSTSITIPQEVSSEQAQQPVSDTEEVLVNGKIVLPVPGNTYSIQRLFNLINANNPRKTSNFITLIGANKQPIDDSHCWQTIPQIKGSASASVIGITSAWIKQNGATKVQVFQDEELIKFLNDDGRLDSTTKDLYKKILLYFKVPIVSSIKDPITGNNQSITVYYRCYLNDPYPGRIKRSVLFSTIPVASIINKWNVN